MVLKLQTNNRTGVNVIVKTSNNNLSHTKCNYKYHVDSIGKNSRKIEEHIKKQLKEDEQITQL